MRFKPKEILVSLPTVLTFVNEGEIAMTAASFNAFVHGKVRMKYELLGILGGQYVGLFYLQRNNESQQLRDAFMAAIDKEEEEYFKDLSLFKDKTPKEMSCSISSVIEDDDSYPEEDPNAV